ncbi:MAG: DUF3558 domain-containing protein [Pseudonocardia sp.]
MSRVVRVLGAAVLATALVGCAAVLPVVPQAGPVIAQRPYEGLAFDISLVPPELRVPRPTDLRGIDACDLLTDLQLAELGLRPESARPGPYLPNRDSCIWSWVDDPLNSAGVLTHVSTRNPALPGLYARAEAIEGFEPVQIAGHPGTRGLSGINGCEIDMATSDDQILGLYDNSGGAPMADPCARPRRMAELVLPTLPPRR